MSTAAGDRKSDIEGTPGAGGPKGAAELTGGYMNYVFIVLNIILAWLGMLLVLASLAALQHQINKDQNIAPESNNWLVLGKDITQGNPSGTYHTFAGFAINSGYPALQPGRLLRFEWFTFFLTFVVLCVVGLAMIGRVIRQTRSMVVGYMAVNLVLAIISTNNVYNLSHFAGHGRHYHSARAVFTGYLFVDIALFGLIYLLGLEF
ncbi:hypothetical protein ABBQ38_002425 [Trebouxia sp. C0009 RCD-2024]